MRNQPSPTVTWLLVTCGVVPVVGCASAFDLSKLFLKKLQISDHFVSRFFCESIAKTRRFYLS
jgi:hypothetical protein